MPSAVPRRPAGAYFQLRNDVSHLSARFNSRDHDPARTDIEKTLARGSRTSVTPVERNGLPRELCLNQPGGYLFPTDPLSKAVVNFYPATVRVWPRLGLAYRPADKWVVRLGGVYNNVDQMNNLTVVGNPLKTFVVDYIHLRHRQLHARGELWCGFRT
jgi:hypothetical protein